MQLINCEIELDLKWTQSCVISEISRTFRAVDPNANPVDYEVVTARTGAKFQINNAETLFSSCHFAYYDNVKFLENLKPGFKRTISWNKYRFEITTLTKNNNLDYLIDPTYRNINRLFVLSLKDGLIAKKSFLISQ